MPPQIQTHAQLESEPRLEGVDMFSAKAWLLLAALGLPTACQASPPNVASASAPPRTCEIRQAAWCIYRDNVTVQHAPSANAKYHSVWKIWGSYWKENPAVVLEPSGCRNGISDVVELVSSSSGFEWNDRSWDSNVVRLRSDGSCDLNLLSPPESADKRKTAFSAKLTLIQACQSDECAGPTLAHRLWSTLQAQRGSGSK